MDYTTRLMYQSNIWYNDGLKKANIRDMSGAITSLRRSLQYNTANIAARNLLGLVYYGRGDVAEALVEWILSKNIQNHDNIANYYISKVQETPGELAEINQALKRYNQSLVYARQRGEDLAIIQLKKAVAAHPTYVKAYQLLAFLYLHTEQYANARQVLRTAHKLDSTDELTLRYMHELNQIRKERPIKLSNPEQQGKQTVTYNIGNETIIQPATNLKEHAGRSATVNILIGVLVGVAVMWFLIMPAMNSAKQKRLNEQVVEFSDQIAEQKAQISALQVELESFRQTSEETANAQATAESTQTSYEALLTLSKHYKAEDMSNAAMLELLFEINPDSLGSGARQTYDNISGDLFPKMSKKYYETSKKNVEVLNYEYAIGNLETVIKIDEGYDDGYAQYLLAYSYQQIGEVDKANIMYQKIIENYPDTEAASKAQEALDVQSQEAAEEEE